MLKVNTADYKCILVPFSHKIGLDISGELYHKDMEYQIKSIKVSLGNKEHERMKIRKIKPFFCKTIKKYLQVVSAIIFI